jgi:hypothetical protein
LHDEPKWEPSRAVMAEFGTDPAGIPAQVQFTMKLMKFS